MTAVGAVIKQDVDTRKQSPIADVEISAPAELGVDNAKSDFSGYFKIICLLEAIPANPSCFTSDIPITGPWT